MGKSRGVNKQYPGSRGFTLIELLITLVIAAIGLALAVPTYQDIVERRQTTAQAEELASFLALAQGQAIKINEPVTVALSHTDASNWCIGASEGTAACDCTETDTTAADYCALEGAGYILDSSFLDKVDMTAHSADTTFVYDPVRGIKDTADLSNHDYTLQSENGNWSLQVNVSPTGRVRVCNPDADKEVPGFEQCTAVAVVPIG